MIEALKLFQVGNTDHLIALINKNIIYKYYVLFINLYLRMYTWKYDFVI